MRRVFLLPSLLASIAAAFAQSDDPCAAFTWDVSQERTLFAQEPQLLAAGQAPATEPQLRAGRLYQLQLRQQSAVAFVLPPGKNSAKEGAYAGLARLDVNSGGVYRIALDQPLWIDVIANGSAIPAKDFQGRRGCNSPHKIVEFLLPTGASVTVQLSGASTATVKVTVTRSPATTTGPVATPPTSR